MILLIVEDERITREGLSKSVDWSACGISKVLCAENGEAGLFMARRVKPDIVLTDIRMPRMDGITMAVHIREILPDCSIIFLSAYSEIEYYKAAIDLKAIHYLDKPIDTERLQTVVSEAAAECLRKRINKSNYELHHLQERQKLADAICAGESELVDYAKVLPAGLNFKAKDSCTAIIARFRMDYNDDMQQDLRDLASRLSELIQYPNIYSLRRESTIVLLLFNPSPLLAGRVESICAKLKEALESYQYYVAAGSAFRGIKNAHKSYLSAKTVMDKAYLHPWKQCLRYSEDAEKVTSISSYDEEKREILNKLSEAESQEVLDACTDLFQKLKTEKDLTYSMARELYFEIISEVFRKADSLHLHIKEEEAGEMISWIVRIEEYNLDELHEFLCRQILYLHTVLNETRNEKKQILAIKDYIAKNYMDSSLAIGDISVFLHMSVSHVCTMYKKETGDTINNYLTEYRLNKAKQYLRETLFTAAEISAKVGYKDSSYFGRIFRKRFGMTPNKYRNSSE